MHNATHECIYVSQEAKRFEYFQMSAEVQKPRKNRFSATYTSTRYEHIA